VQQQCIEEMAAANLRGAGLGASAASGSLTAHAWSEQGASALPPRAGASSEEGDEDSGSEPEFRPRLRSLGDSVTSAARFEEELEGASAGVGAATDGGPLSSRSGYEAVPADDFTLPPWALGMHTDGGGSGGGVGAYGWDGAELLSRRRVGGSTEDGASDDDGAQPVVRYPPASH
jgi:hypothetical protein